MSFRPKGEIASNFPLSVCSAYAISPFGRNDTLNEQSKIYFTNLMIAISNAKNNSAKITNHFQI